MKSWDTIYVMLQLFTSKHVKSVHMREIEMFLARDLPFFGQELMTNANR